MKFVSLSDGLFQKLDQEQLNKINGGRSNDTCQNTFVTTASNPSEGDPTEEDDDISSIASTSAVTKKVP